MKNGFDALAFRRGSKNRPSVRRKLRKAGALVAGVDGCSKGWLVVMASGTRRLRLRVVCVAPTFRELLARTRPCAAVAVDIPIGLSDGPARAADRAARRLLGRPRASSVFPAPVRAALAGGTYRDACDRSLGASGRRMTKESYNILAKVREVDRVMTPRLQRRVVEAHPEVSFWALNGGRALRQRKKSLEGRRERRELLRRVFGEGLGDIAPPPGAAWDDLYDACVLAWSAWRLATGQARRLPPAPPLDSRGLRMEIVC